MENYDNLVEAIAGLKSQGYVEDFNLNQNHIACSTSSGDYQVFHNEFQIDKYFRFFGDSDPEDESIIYAVSSDKYNLKGILVNGYGTSSEELTNEMTQKLSFKVS